MKALFRLSLCTSLFGVFLVGGSYACPQLSARLGLNLSEWREAQQQLEYEYHRSESLYQQGQIVRKSLEAKFQVVEELHEGRLTLPEAAAQFRDLHNLESDPNRELFRLLYKGQSDDERWCRQVISFVRGGNSEKPDLVPVADQLEAELAQDLAKGSFHLPD